MNPDYYCIARLAANNKYDFQTHRANRAQNASETLSQIIRSNHSPCTCIGLFTHGLASLNAMSSIPLIFYVLNILFCPEDSSSIGLSDRLFTCISSFKRRT
jgi:hypothetical protein